MFLVNGAASHHCMAFGNYIPPTGSKMEDVAAKLNGYNGKGREKQAGMMKCLWSEKS